MPGGFLISMSMVQTEIRVAGQMLDSSAPDPVRLPLDPYNLYHDTLNGRLEA